MAEKFEDILYEVEPPLVVITINRPHIRNACRVHTMKELARAVKAAGDDRDVRVVILTGAGDKAFSAGADLKEARERAPVEHSRDLVEGWYEALRQIERLRKPVIAGVRGWAVGGGTELAMACHLVIAGTSARFGQPEILRGHIPGGGGTVRMPRLVGQSRALYYLLTGEDLSAVEAERIGLVTKVVDDARVVDEAKALGRRIARLSRLAVELTLRSVIGGRDASVEAALALERALCGEMLYARDYVEGLDAFVEKREPRYDAEGA
jgi:enoyl-CoA hydratase/carnithine racemase